jgi:copper chaperone CopZ
MKKITLDLPAMYGDHHVLEVRRMLYEIPGVDDVYASSAFRAIEVTFDPAKASPEQIKGVLDAAGYAEDLPVPIESGEVTYQGNGNRQAFFRHTATYETTRTTVSFQQRVQYEGRPLWPCPGMGPLKTSNPEEE